MDFSRLRLEREYSNALVTASGFSVAGLAFLASMFADPLNPNRTPWKAVGALGSVFVATKAAKDEERYRKELAIVSGGEFRAVELEVWDGLKRFTESLTTVSQPLPAAPLGEFDLAQAMVDTDLHILIASASGTGKTTLLLAAIARLPGDAQVYIFDPKNSPEFADFPNYMNVEGKEKIQEMILKLQDLEQELMHRKETRSSPYPVIILADEYNSLLEDSEGTKDKEGTHRYEINRLLKKFITQGRAFDMHVWIAAQSPLVQDIDFNTSIRESMDIIALGKTSKFASIDKALKNDQVIYDDEDRKRIKEQFAWFKQTHKGSTARVAVTNLGGNQIIKVPNYSGQFVATSGSVDCPDMLHLEAELEALFREFSLEPENQLAIAGNTDEIRETAETTQDDNPSFDPFGGCTYELISSLCDLAEDSPEERDNVLRSHLERFLAMGINRTQIVKRFWGVKSGGKYQDATKEYDRLMGKTNE